MKQSLNQERAIVPQKYAEGTVVEVSHSLQTRLFYFFKSKGVWIVTALMAIPGVALLVYDFKVKPKELPQNAWEVKIISVLYIATITNEHPIQDPAALENILRQGEF